MPAPNPAFTYTWGGCCAFARWALARVCLLAALPTGGYLQAQPGIELPATEVWGQSVLRHQLSSWHLQANALGQWPVGGLWLGNALQQVPGAYLRTYGGHGSVQTLGLRGFAANHTTVSINGVPLADARFGAVDLSPFLLSSIGSIKLEPGAPNATQNSLAGNLDLGMRPRPTQWKAAAGYGRFGEAQLGLERHIDREKWSMVAAAWGLRSTEDFPFRHEGSTHTRTPANLNSLQGLAYAEGQPNPRTHLSSLTWGWWRQQQVPGPVVSGNPATTSTTLQQWQVFHYSQWAGRPRQLDGRLSLLQHKTTLRLMAENLEYADTPPQENRLYDLLLQTQRQHRLGPGVLSITLQGTGIWLNSAQYRPQVPRRLGANLGLQHAAGWVKTERFRLGTTLLLRGNLAEGPGALPNASLRVLASLGQNGWASVQLTGGLSHRLPSFNELYYYSLGNPNLKPERAQSLDAGLLVRPHHRLPLQVRMTGFANQTQNKILAVPLSPARWQTQTLGRTESLGAEAALEGRPWPWLLANLQATLLLTRDRSLTPGSTLPYSPANLLQASLNAESRVLWGGLSLLHSSSRWASLANDRLSWMAPYLLLDAHAGLRLPLPRLRGLLLLSLAAENALNTSYQLIQGYPMPGWRLRGHLQWVWGLHRR